MSEASKSVGRSVSMPEDIWDIVDKHAGADEASGDRSSYIYRLVLADLTAAGKIPGSPTAIALAEARDLIEALGADEFRRRLGAVVAA